MNAFTRTMILAAALVLAGCATYQVADMPAGSTTEQVAARAGKPTDTWRDGSTEVWEYATGPAGRMTYLARFDDGRLTSTRQVLTEETFQKVVPGVTRQQVHHMLGRPVGVLKVPRKGEEVWSWRYLEDLRGMAFNVHFDEAKGVVRETSRSVDTPEQRIPFWIYGGW